MSGVPKKEVSHMKEDPFISIIIPVLNEEEAIPHFVEVVEGILEKSSCRFELLFVNDGSTDSTSDVLHQMEMSDHQIRIIEFTRNFGKEAAVTAGLEHAEGDAVIPMDVDLQDPPELILQFIEKWKEGNDVVYGKRVRRHAEGWLRRVTAGLFYGSFNLLSPFNFPSNVGDYRLMDRSVVEVIKLLPEKSRFMKGLFAWAGFHAVEIPYHRPSRSKGKSKWNYWKLWNFALDGILNFSTIPLRIWTYVGGIIALGSFCYGLVIIGQKLFFGNAVPGYPSLMTCLLFLGGIQLLSLGIIGEYIARIFNEVKNRPLYVIKKKREDN
ncbi:MAG: glycosyltransferase family 2 protein [Puniceicoccaceae bacterium]